MIDKNLLYDWFVLIFFHFRSDVHKLLAKWDSLYDQRQIHAQNKQQYTDAYITDKLLPMWPSGWMKMSELQSQFLSKPKEKDVKKSSNEHKMSKSQHPINNMASASSLNAEILKAITTASAASAPPPSTQPIAAAATATTATTAAAIPGINNAEKRKSHTVKESTKMPKHHAHDKPTVSKTEKKHHHSTSDRSVVAAAMPTLAPTTVTSVTAAATSLLSTPLSDIYSSKSVCFYIPYFIHLLIF